MRRKGKPVAQMAVAGVRVDTARRSVPRQAPSPRTAVNVSPRQRRVHHADDGTAVLHQRHRDAHDREAVQEVGRAVERIDQPPEGLAVTAPLLAEDGDPGRLLVEDAPDHVLARVSTSLT